MESMVKCACGNIVHVNAGDRVQGDIYTWYASYHCDKCGESIEMDGYAIDSVPNDIKALIVKKEGEWGLERLAGKAKIKYLMNKVLQSENVDFPEKVFFAGPRNQVKWVEKELIKKGMCEKDFASKRL